MQGKRSLIGLCLLPAIALGGQIADMSVQTQPLDEHCNQFFSPEVRQSEARMAGGGIICVKGERIVQPASEPQPGNDNAIDSQLRELRELPATSSGKRRCQSGRKQRVSPENETVSPPA
ncbi:hypothetical protein [Simiduia agarivorans]|uniref:Uncharacterized protein n=1 Tax=Simiduia agarivorans (strain DSM 21679 / JCM 13881 / BCRC 17597 / SA1) TaxID=1117647 RepID=K4L2G2_SIMAS|nr:hypothetical protein [Simiduia agarivorans]AFV00378.1 hypothetical protein M5M_16225 [Simiduia agarivorans SA1 = DSM 21679]